MRRNKQLQASNEMHLERSFKTKMEPFKMKLSTYMKENECNGVEWRSNGGRNNSQEDAGTMQDNARALEGE